MGSQTDLIGVGAVAVLGYLVFKKVKDTIDPLTNALGLGGGKSSSTNEGVGATGTGQISPIINLLTPALGGAVGALTGNTEANGKTGATTSDFSGVGSSLSKVVESVSKNDPLYKALLGGTTPSSTVDTKAVNVVSSNTSNKVYTPTTISNADAQKSVDLSNKYAALGSANSLADMAKIAGVYQNLSPSSQMQAGAAPSVAAATTPSVKKITYSSGWTSSGIAGSKFTKVISLKK